MEDSTKQQPSDKITETEIVTEALKAAKPVYSNDLPLINDKHQRLSRKFLGDINGRGKDKKEFQTYLKGGSTFEWQKKKHAVRQEFFYV